MSAEEFFAAYLEQNFLYSAQLSGRSLGALFQVSDLESLICQMHDLGDIKTTGGRTEHKDAPYHATGNNTQMGRLFGDYTRGKTIIVNGIHRRWEPVRQLCAALAADLVMTLQCNLYVTPANAQGLDCHWDGHDVLILQVDGSKDWTLYPMIDDLPAPNSEGKSVTPDAAPLKQLTLRAGDVLYMPRGMPHVAQATDETSAHLTIGLIGVTWQDVMQAAVHVAAETRQDMRRVLPSDWLAHGVAGPSLPIAYKEAASALADEDVLRRALDLVAAEVISQAPAPSSGHFLSLDLVDAITLSTQVTRQSGSLARCVTGDEDITLHFPGGKITNSDKALWAFSFFVETPSFCVRDIPGWYNDDERLTLAKDLVRAGMYTISRLSTPDTSKVSSAQSVVGSG